MIVGGRNLYDIGADDVERLQCPKNGERLAARA
jgi:hypothetical protein